MASLDTFCLKVPLKYLELVKKSTFIFFSFAPAAQTVSTIEYMHTLAFRPILPSWVLNSLFPFYKPPTGLLHGLPSRALLNLSFHIWQATYWPASQHKRFGPNTHHWSHTFNFFLPKAQLYPKLGSITQKTIVRSGHNFPDTFNCWPKIKIQIVFLNEKKIHCQVQTHELMANKARKKGKKNNRQYNANSKEKSFFAPNHFALH